MSKNSSKQATDFLDSEKQHLAPLFAKIKAINELNQLIKPLLDEKLREYCQVANVIGNKLILTTANSSVATQIRFQSAEMVARLKQHPRLAMITSIHCKVAPSTAPATPSRAKVGRKMKPLSQQTADIIRDVAENIQDERLRKIMERIADSVILSVSKDD